jgi:kynurenine formamidase
MMNLKIKRIVDMTRIIDSKDPNWQKDEQWGAQDRDKLIKVEPYVYVPDRCLVEDITMWSHLGTHIESPYHQYMLRGGKSIGELPIETFAGEGIVINMSYVGMEEDMEKVRERADRMGVTGKLITDEDMKPLDKKIKKGDIVFFYTDWEIPDIPLIGTSAAHWLVDKGVKCVGVSEQGIIMSFGGHSALLENGIPMVEDFINCDQVVDKRIFLVCAPLRIVGLGGTPCRAFAIEFEEK